MFHDVLNMYSIFSTNISVGASMTIKLTQSRNLKVFFVSLTSSRTTTWTIFRPILRRKSSLSCSSMTRLSAHHGNFKKSGRGSKQFLCKMNCVESLTPTMGNPRLLTTFSRTREANRSFGKLNIIEFGILSLLLNPK